MFHLWLFIYLFWRFCDFLWFTPLAIAVSQARNLTSAKGDLFPVHSSVRIIFQGETVDSDIPIRDNKNPQFNFLRTFERAVTSSFVDSLLNDGLDVVVLEGSSHRTILGNAHIDLAQLVLTKQGLLLKQPLSMTLSQANLKIVLLC